MDELDKLKSRILDKINYLESQKSTIVIEGEELRHQEIILGYYQLLTKLISKP